MDGGLGSRDDRVGCALVTGGCALVSAPVERSFATGAELLGLLIMGSAWKIDGVVDVITECDSAALLLSGRILKNAQRSLNVSAFIKNKIYRFGGLPARYVRVDSGGAEPGSAPMRRTGLQQW